MCNNFLEGVKRIYIFGGKGAQKLCKMLDFILLFTLSDQTAGGKQVTKKVQIV